MRERNVLVKKVKNDSNAIEDTFFTVKNVANSEKIVNMTVNKSTNSVRDDCTSDSDSTDDAKKRKEQ